MSLFGVTYYSPDWCYNGLNPETTDFSTTGMDSPAGYKSGSIRLYSRAACQSLAGVGGVFAAGGECYGVSVEGKIYNASTACAGLNNTTSENVILPGNELDDMCPPSENGGYLLAIVLLSVFCFMLLHR